MASPLIYIFDDDAANNNLTRILLEDVGFENFRQYYMAIDALAVLKEIAAQNKVEEYPEIILSDINMPKMDGWEFLHEFRLLSAQVNWPHVYLLSSSDYPGDIEKA